MRTVDVEKARRIVNYELFKVALRVEAPWELKEITFDDQEQAKALGKRNLEYEYKNFPFAQRR